MIKVYSNVNFPINFRGAYDESLEAIRIALREYVRNSDLSWSNAISSFLKEGVGFVTDSNLSIEMYSIGNCAITKVEGFVVLTDYTNINLDVPNEIIYNLA